MNELALFAGAGGGILGGCLLGWRTVCAVELDPYAASVLVARQNDGLLPPFPIWDDVRSFDGRPWRGRVDVVSGGFPCQDISNAGSRSGLAGARSGLWSEMARIIRDVEPRHVFVENVPALTRRGLHVVLGNLASMGYDAKWGVLGARNAGAPHRRERIWLVANANSGRRQELRLEEHADEQGAQGRLADGCGEDGWRSGALDAQLGDANRQRLAQREGERSNARQKLTTTERTSWWKSEPDVGRVAHGVAARVDRLRAIGNGQVSAVAALAWEALSDEG